MTQNIPAHVWVGAAAFGLPIAFMTYEALTTPSMFAISPAALGPVALFALAIAALAAIRRRILTSPVAGARIESHRCGPGRPLDTIRHELGHKRAIEKQGGRVSEFVVNADGSGHVKGYLPESAGVVGSGAVRVAGGLAEGTFRWATGDLANLDRDLKTLPASERPAARRAAYSEARSILFWSPVEGEARRLYRQGWS